MRIDLKGLRLRVSGFKDSEENPKFNQINVSVHPKIEEADYHKLKRLSELAEKYCTVGNTVKIETKISIQIHPSE